MEQKNKCFHFIYFLNYSAVIGKRENRILRACYMEASAFRLNWIMLNILGRASLCSKTVKFAYDDIRSEQREEELTIYQLFLVIWDTVN